MRSVRKRGYQKNMKSKGRQIEGRWNVVPVTDLHVGDVFVFNKLELHEPSSINILLEKERYIKYNTKGKFWFEFLPSKQKRLELKHPEQRAAREKYAEIAENIEETDFHLLSYCDNTIRKARVLASACVILLRSMHDA